MQTTYELNHFTNFGPPAISAERLNKMDEAIKESIENRISKAIEVTVTLYASGWQWNEDKKCYTYTIKVGDVQTISNEQIEPKLPISETSTQTFYPAIGITTQQLRALQKADIQDGGQDASKLEIILQAHGIVPEINIPIRISIQEAIYKKSAYKNLNTEKYPLQGQKGE